LTGAEILKTKVTRTESSREKQVPGEVEFYQSIVDLIQQARTSLAKSVNTTMVITHYFAATQGVRCL
jgi:hypothetical protein